MISPGKSRPFPTRGRLIKRYGGARLYDPAKGRYVSAEELRRPPKGGVAVVIIDAHTGADVTREVLG